MIFDPAAAQVAKLLIHLGPGEHGVGAGFLMAGPGGPCLATAFHNLSGGVPAVERMKNRWRPRMAGLEIVYGGRVLSNFMPYCGGRSLFRVHPRPGDYAWCDVAVIDMDIMWRFALDEARDSPFWSLSGIDGAERDDEGGGYARVTDMYLSAGRDAMVFGFPGGRDFREGPIGLNCKIAAEAGNEEPCLLLSGYTSAGCSGAPAVMREFGGYLAVENGGPIRRQREVSRVDQWLGLYSGRLSHLTAHAERHWTQIGVVWSARTVSQVALHGVYDML